MGPFKKLRVYQLQFLCDSGVAKLSKIDKVFSEKEEMKKKSGKRLSSLTNSFNGHER
jgi:hypothetical protein